MPKYDDHSERRGAGDRRSRTHTGSKDWSRGVRWLDWLPITWAGDGSGQPATPYLDVCRTTRSHLIDRLTGKSPGLYCIELHPGVHSAERIGKVQRVTPQLVAKATTHLSKLTHQSEVPDGWRDSIQDRLRHISLALHDEVGVESECITLWLGPVGKRPSKTATTKTLTDALGRTTDPGIRCALATALGQRRQPAHSRELTPWRELGTLLPTADLFIVHQSSRAAGKRMATVLGRVRSMADRARWWEALAEQMIGRWPQRPMLEKFADGLAAVIPVADHLRRLPSDRLNRLLHCIGDAMRRTEAFTPMSSGQGYAWNHPFMAECRQVLREQLSLRLPPSVEAGLSGGIQDVCRWFMGMELRDIDLMRLKKIQTAADADPNFLFMKRLTDVFDRRLVVDVARQQSTLAGVCGALADANPEIRLREIAGWVLHCCETCLPGEDGADPLRLAVQCLTNSYLNLGDTDAANRVTTVAAKHGNDVLRFLEHRLALTLRPATYENMVVPLTQTEDNYENALLLLASLPRRFEDTIPLLLTEHLTPWLSAVTKGKPDRLEAALDFVSAVDDEWFRLPAPSKWTWAYALRTDDARLAVQLTNWTLRLRQDHDLSWDDVDMVLSDVMRFADESDREAFLVSQPGLLKTVTASAALAVDEDGDDFESAFGIREPIFDLTFRWHACYGDGASFADDMLERMHRRPDQSLAVAPVPQSGWEAELAVLLADGQPDQLITILKGASFGTTICDVDPVAAWRWLDQFPDVRSLITECAKRNELLPEISKFLQRIDLGLRLQSGPRLKRELIAWSVGTAVEDLGDVQVPEAHREAFDRIAFHRKACGKSPVPGPLLKILDRPAALRRELEALEAKVKKGEPSDTALMRAEKLRGYMTDAEALARQTGSALATELGKQTALARIHHLQALALAAVSDYWTTLCGTNAADVAEPKWINLLTLYLDVKHNRRLLREMIRMAVVGETLACADHPVNRTFLKDVAAAGIDGDRWEHGPTQSFGHDGGQWSIGIETDCLEILRMGQIFGTCLRPGGDHSYAVVANAAEVNKQVIIIRDAAGEVVGRKLIALSRDGMVFGFRSYGRGAVCKAAADRYCREHADRCGATLATPEREAALVPEDLELFAKWYFDGTESFDPWLTAPDPRTFASQLLESQGDVLADEDPSMLARLQWYASPSW